VDVVAAQIRVALVGLQVAGPRQVNVEHAHGFEAGIDLTNIQFCRKRFRPNFPLKYCTIITSKNIYKFSRTLWRTVWEFEALISRMRS
jgi:hypothetical protein